MKSRTEKAREHIMKNKWVKRLLLASAAGLLAGGICVGAGTAMGGSPMFYVNAQGIHVKEDQKPEDSADYRLEAQKREPCRIYISIWQKRISGSFRENGLRRNMF